ncbi:NAD(P)-dependent oxidoreductase [Frankia gtarii]|uniref:NAD(P)-dependent oxidoreductase n=1 Tax=Frankia gtarii TaxID=2950102 RepID=UPI0021C03A0E|nr:SDR family oxidoreductase [Frankia gtarii]
MKLLIFGATGGTGAHLLTRALDDGHAVTVVARDPGKIAVGDRAWPTVITGDVLEPLTWRAAVGGHDAVLSCLGSTDRKHPTTVYSQGATNIIDVMGRAGVRRLMCLSSAGLDIPPGTPLPQRLVTRLVIQRLYRHGYTDMRAMENIVAASDTDWTIIRPPMLTNGPPIGNYRAAANAHLSKPKAISRADLADYLLTHIGDRESWPKTVEVSS